MTITRKTLGALTLGLIVAATASPSFAQRAEQGAWIRHVSALSTTAPASQGK